MSGLDLIKKILKIQNWRRFLIVILKFFHAPIEKRFSKKQIYNLMKKSGLEKIKFKNGNPFWLSIGYKK